GKYSDYSRQVNELYDKFYSYLSAPAAASSRGGPPTAPTRGRPRMSDAGPSTNSHIDQASPKLSATRPMTNGTNRLETFTRAPTAITSPDCPGRVSYFFACRVGNQEAVQKLVRPSSVYLTHTIGVRR